MKIRTNNQPRRILYGCELTESERQEFDYIEDIDFADCFVRYKGRVYDLGEFARITKVVAPHPQREGWENWDGYASDSFFSGVLVRYVDSDSVVVATYFC